MSIEELKKQRQNMYKQSIKKSQLPYALLVLLLVIMTYMLVLRKFQFGYIIFYGILIGYTLQRSKFCFAASIRDVILLKKTKLLRAILLGMMIATVGFGMKQYEAISMGAPIPGQIGTVGIHTIIGGILFGLGMVIAGGCVSGTFTRIGEGYILQWITLGGLVIGTALGMANFKILFDCFIKAAPKVYFGEYVPITILIVLQVIVLAGLVIGAYYFEKSKRR